MNDNSFFKQWRGNFFAGLALVLPSVITVAIVVWIFRNVSNLTDTLLFFLPPTWTHEVYPNGQLGAIYWYWSLVALTLAILLICLVGRFGRNYFARKTMEWVDHTLMRVPLMNKIYGTVKQVNSSFSSNKSSFKQVVLVTFPHARSRSVGFVTGEQKGPDSEKLISVFIPTTPNPTSGFLVMVPESEVTKLEMSVADGIKFIISLGALMPEHPGQVIVPPDAKALQPVLK
jgi:uncharacterized membrane protein